MASHPRIVLRLLSWNLFHGRDCPPNPALRTLRSKLLRISERDATHVQVNRSLRGELCERLAGWEWDVALLQEAPPRWRTALQRACGGVVLRDLTSRNALAPLRALAAAANPDLVGSNEGGSNMVVARGPARIVDSYAETLARRPERRRLLLARIALADGRAIAVACTHLSVPSTGQGRDEALRAAELAVEWAAGEPLVLGGDLNLRPAHHGAAFRELEARFGLAPPTAPRSIDHLLCRGLDVVEAPAPLPDAARDVAAQCGLAIRLSDHAPVAATVGVR